LIPFDFNKDSIQWLLCADDKTTLNRLARVGEFGGTGVASKQLSLFLFFIACASCELRLIAPNAPRNIKRSWRPR
jgi:hypothetical protein